VSVVGRGIASEGNILSEIFTTLSRNRIHVEAVTTSELSINIFLRRRYMSRAVEALLDKFRLKRG
jgi:aspartokinase